MAPLVSFFVGYRISTEALNQYRTEKNLPPSNSRFLLQDLESSIGVPLALVSVDEGGSGAETRYLCCFADYSGRIYDSAELLAIPVPSAFDQLPQLTPVVEGGLHRLGRSRTTVWSFDEEGVSRVNAQALPIGG